MCHITDIAVHHPNAEEGVLSEESILVRIPGSMAYIRLVRDAVDTLADRVALSSEDRAAVKLAVGEACNNAVQHASPDGNGRPGGVVVALRIGQDSLEIDVANEGDGFCPSATMPVAEALSESGRGLALIEMMMDSVEYLQQEGNTVVRMRKQHRPRLPKIVTD
jgi:serine/threonine-protein kinase RsbW